MQYNKNNINRLPVFHTDKLLTPYSISNFEHIEWVSLFNNQTRNIKIPCVKSLHNSIDLFSTVYFPIRMKLLFNMPIIYNDIIIYVIIK